jgi:YggT family protein
MGHAIVWLVVAVINLVSFLVLARAIVSWLIAFDVINVRNRFAYEVSRFLEAVTDPMLRPIQRVVPRLGGVDISAIVLLLLLQFVKILFLYTAAGPLIALLG